MRNPAETRAFKPSSVSSRGPVGCFHRSCSLPGPSRVFAQLISYCSSTIGFWRRLEKLRWLALALYALTVGKVLLLDMAGLQEFYRILAFFVVAVLLSIAGWAYHRVQLESKQSGVLHDAQN